MNVRVPSVATSKNSDPSKLTLAMPPHLEGQSCCNGLPGGLEICPIPGRHFEIMKEPHVGTLSAELPECLEELHARYAPKSSRLGIKS